MRILCERRGGFAGITRKTTVDTANIPESQARQLSELVEAANFFNLPAEITASSTQPDRFEYKLTVEDGGKKHTVTVSEAALPGTLKTLIELLEQVKS